jgi:hypothetical protein
VAFLVLFLIPGLIALGFLIFGGRKVTLKEFGVQLAAQAVVAAISAAVIYWSDTADTEVWNGRITSKEHQHVSCRHSYDCHCHEVCSGSGKNRSCYEHCDTCYEHSYDVEWTAQSTVGSYDIDTVDRQGLVEPPRWTAIIVGEPAAKTHGYTSYIKAAPDSLFRRDGDYKQFDGTLPEYPGKVFDYYRINRLVQVGANLPDATDWNKDLSEANADLGARKQVNIVFVAVSGKPREWFYALEKHWLGGKKNDVVVVADVDDGALQWVQVMAWTSNEMVRVRLRDDLMGLKTLDRAGAMKAIREDVDQFFVRKPMAEFKYLEASITPSETEWTVSLIIGMLVAFGIGWFMVVNDVFQEEDQNEDRTRRYRRTGTDDSGSW